MSAPCPLCYFDALCVDVANLGFARSNLARISAVRGHVCARRLGGPAIGFLPASHENDICRVFRALDLRLHSGLEEPLDALRARCPLPRKGVRRASAGMRFRYLNPRIARFWPAEASVLECSTRLESRCDRAFRRLCPPWEAGAHQRASPICKFCALGSRDRGRGPGCPLMSSFEPRSSPLTHISYLESARATSVPGGPEARPFRVGCDLPRISRGNAASSRGRVAAIRAWREGPLCKSCICRFPRSMRGRRTLQALAGGGAVGGGTWGALSASSMKRATSPLGR